MKIPSPQSIWAATLDLVAPLRCPVCGRVLAEAARCPDCRMPDPARVARTLGQDARGPYLILTGGALTGRYRRLLHAFKYTQDPGARALLTAQTVLALPPGGGWDALVPVPTHAVRRRERGFDAVEALGRDLSLALRMPLLRLLRRVRYCAPLTGRGALERRRLVEETVAAAPSWGRLLLLDDVATTGTTFRTCRRLLLAAGAESVDLLVAAHRPRARRRIVAARRLC